MGNSPIIRVNACSMLCFRLVPRPRPQLPPRPRPSGAGRRAPPWLLAAGLAAPPAVGGAAGHAPEPGRAPGWRLLRWPRLRLEAAPPLAAPPAGGGCFAGRAPGWNPRSRPRLLPRLRPRSRFQARGGRGAPGRAPPGRGQGRGTGALGRAWQDLAGGGRRRGRRRRSRDAGARVGERRGSVGPARCGPLG